MYNWDWKLCFQQEAFGIQAWRVQRPRWRKDTWGMWIALTWINNWMFEYVSRILMINGCTILKLCLRVGWSRSILSIPATQKRWILRKLEIENVSLVAGWRSVPLLDSVQEDSQGEETSFRLHVNVSHNYHDGLNTYISQRLWQFLRLVCKHSLKSSFSGQEHIPPRHLTSFHSTGRPQPRSQSFLTAIT